jgi:hypothetical protein
MAARARRGPCGAGSARGPALAGPGARSSGAGPACRGVRPLPRSLAIQRRSSNRCEREARALRCRSPIGSRASSASRCAVWRCIEAALRSASAICSTRAPCRRTTSCSSARTRPRPTPSSTDRAAVQQRRCPAVRPLAPGSLSLAEAGSAPEREARSFARGSLAIGDLSRAPAALYREEKKAPGENDKDQNDQPTALRPWEERFKRFLADASNPYRLKDLGDDKAVFARVSKKKEELKPEEKFKRSSESKFPHGKYAEIVKDAVDGDLPKIAALGAKWQLATVGASEQAQRYALIDDGAYQDKIFEIGAGEKLSEEEKRAKNAAKLKDYKKYVAKITKSKTWAATWNPTVKDPESVTDAELDDARRDMRRRIVEDYRDDIAGLFKDVIQNKEVFPPPYSRIQGYIFEDWVKQYRPYALKNARALFFPNKAAGDRFGDVVIKEESPGPPPKVEFLIGEAKGLTGKPGKDEVEQMEAYFRLLSDPKEESRRGYWKEDEQVTDTKDGETKTVTKARSGICKKVIYHFADATVAGPWMEELVRVFKTRPELFDTVDNYPKEAAADTVTETTKVNPVLTIVVDDAKNADTKHRIPTPKVDATGIKLQYFEVVLAAPGHSPILSGELSMDVDTKGGTLSSDKPTVKKIAPATPAAAAPVPKPGAKKEVVTGTVANGLDDVKPSGLDKFLKRIHGEVKLVDDGIAGRVWVDPGESFIKKVNLDKAEIAASYTKSKGFAARGEVAVSYQPDPKKFHGGVTVEYKGGKWSITGKGTVAGLIEGLDPFDVVIKHENDVTTIGAENLKLKKKLGAIDLVGQVKILSYNVGTGGFSADGIHFDLDLGAFGKAGADASIADNELTKLAFSYESKELQYPKGKTPVIAGKLKGSVEYDKGKYSGGIGGTAYLKIPALEKISKGLGDLGFVIDVKVGEKGFSGSIALAEDKPIPLGQYFRIPQLKLELDEQGAISSTFAVEVTEKLKYVKEARIACRITKEGKFEVLEAKGKLKIGDETKDRVAAELGLSYNRDKASFIVSGKLWVRIKPGMVAVGELVYDTGTGKIDATLSVERIQLLSWSGSKDLLKIKKQITLFMIYVLGLYLDVRFELGFKYSFSLGITPKLKLEGLDPEELTFKLAIAIVTLDGLLSAELIGKPGIGLGLFAFHPKVLRGGGGLALPISAKAQCRPSGTVVIKYKPSGEVEGAARVGLTLTFGIKAALVPYAEFSVLDGLYEPTWEGDALKEFVIMEERELFTHYVDFGQSLEKKEGDPELPSGEQGKPPPAKGSDEARRIGTEQPPGKAEDPPRGKRDEELPDKPKEEPKEGKKEGGFDFMTMVGQLLNSPKFAPIKKVLQAASDTWDAITGVFKAIFNFFKKWFDVIKEGIDAFVEAIRVIADKGLIYYFKQLLQRKLGALWNIIAPLFEALEKVAGKFEALIAKLMDDPIPLTPIAFLKWTLSTIAAIFEIAVSGIVEVVKALGKVLSNALDAFLDFVNYLIQEGRLGVRRYVYYIPRPIVKNIYFYAPTEYKVVDVFGFSKNEKVDGDLVGLADVADPSRVAHKAIAFLLWEFFEASSRIHSTGGHNDPDVDDDTCRDYWVDK